MKPLASLFQDSVLDEIQELFNSCQLLLQDAHLAVGILSLDCQGLEGSCVPVGSAQGYTQGLCSGPHKLLLKLFLLCSCTLPPTSLLSVVYLPPMDRCMCP